MNKDLVKQLAKTRKSVKQKYQSLKSDIAHSQSQLEKSYKPITEPLQKLLTTIKTDGTIKQEPAEVKTETPTSTPRKSKAYNKYLPSLPMTMPSFFEDTFQYDPRAGESFGNEQNSSDLIDEEVERSRIFLQDLSKTKAYEEYLDAYDPLPRQYIDLSIRGDEKDNDRQYGIKHDTETEKFKIGGSDLDIVGKNIEVKGLTYTGTPGLYELLFKKAPVGYKQSDLDNYMDILNRSNAYRRHFSPDEQIQGSQSEKYRTIIKPYLLKRVY